MRGSRALTQLRSPARHRARICPLPPPTAAVTDVPSLVGRREACQGRLWRWAWRQAVGMQLGGSLLHEVLDKPQNEDTPVGESEQMNREVRRADRLRCGSPPHQVSVSSDKFLKAPALSLPICRMGIPTACSELLSSSYAERPLVIIVVTAVVG